MKTQPATGETYPKSDLFNKASSNMKFCGIGVARLGDPVSCPIKGHGPTVIAEGHPTFSDHGIPVAFHGHRCACGCILLSSLPQARVR
ncbi:PAAR domain-containing protein [Klebsiella quasipneumoniae]|uniref:PAAR domain-containing protein n=1 Tax=Klebsiella quasipneumoniae TaxID=1463165 RepID=UPI0021DA4329|nr:PAAR domain-containing protein [Klebsiella quasipneumoniae]MCU8820529.1 PAAR domain-containing protein [Klebsiella quasipneumoniae]